MAGRERPIIPEILGQLAPVGANRRISVDIRS